MNSYEKKMIVYHGTNASFEDFDITTKGKNTEYNNTVHGFFFTDKVEHAKMFGDRIIQAEITLSKTVDLRIQGIFNLEDQASIIYEILSGEKVSPKQALENLNEDIGLGEIGELFDELNTEKASDAFKKAGYDSIVSNLGAGNDEYIVFNSSQIKQLDRNYKKQEFVQLNFNKLKENRLHM